MARTAIFILGALLSIASTFSNELPDFASPVASFLSQDHLVTSVRSAAAHAPKTAFKGKVVGKCVKVGGVGLYSGKFQGFTSRRKTIVNFKFYMKGAVANPQMKIGYKVKVGGKVAVHKKFGKTILAIKTKYGGAIAGYVKKTYAKGAFYGKFGLIATEANAVAKDHGSFRYYYGQKLVVGKYFSTVENDVVKYGVYGKIAGKYFFIKYATSVNVLFLTANVNPMMVKRNYGKVYITVRGKTVVQKFDSKTMMPQIRM